MFSFLSSFSTSSWILFGVIALVAVVVIWKWWKKPVDESKKNDDLVPEQQKKMIEEETGPPPQESLSSAEPPPMVFAVNDQGNFDLTDMSGKILNIGFGPNPKTYINLLDQAEKDTDKVESETGVTFTSKVGNTKLYEVAGRPYIVNYTRL
jgi:hypothetical protein